MAQTFVAAGYLKRTENPVRYHLGAQLYALTRQQDQLGFTAARDQGLFVIFTGVPGASIFYCEGIGQEVVVTAHITTGGPGKVEHNVDHPLPAYHSLGSMIHLAFWPENLVRRYIESHPFNSHGTAVWGDLAELEAQLATIREKNAFYFPMKNPSLIRAGFPVFEGKTLRGSITVAYNLAPNEKSASIRKKIGSVAGAAANTLSTFGD